MGIGFIELTLRTLGVTFPNMGFLIVRDPVATAVAERKRQVPDVNGSNIVRDIKQALLEMHGDTIRMKS